MSAISAIELINLGCAIISASAGVAPLVQKWKPKDGRQKAMKRSQRKQRILAQEESHLDTTRLRSRSSIEQSQCTCSSSRTRSQLTETPTEIDSRNIEDLIQAQVAATLQSILKEGSINSIGFEDGSIDLECEPAPDLVDHIRRKTLESSIRACSFREPNYHRQKALEGPPLQALPFSVLEPSQDIAIQPHARRSMSFSVADQCRHSSLESPHLRAMSSSMPNPRQPMSPGTPLLRASSFPLPNKYQRKSPKLRPRAPPTPMPDQWRRSLKLSPSALSSPRMREANTITFPHSRAGSFHDILGFDLLLRILPYLDNVLIQALIHHAKEWSYSQTLAQLLHPDHIYLKRDAVMRQSYLSSSTRLHIWRCACIMSESSPQGAVLTLPIATFLIRFIMQYGTNILLEVPRQLDDPTGLRELESRYEIAEEILIFLEGK